MMKFTLAALALTSLVSCQEVDSNSVTTEDLSAAIRAEQYEDKLYISSTVYNGTNLAKADVGEPLNLVDGDKLYMINPIQMDLTKKKQELL